MRSYSACLLGAAVHSLFPAVIPLKWHADDFSFTYDFAAPTFMGRELMQIIEEKMRVLKKMHFETKSMMRENAVAFFKHKMRPLQARIIEELPQNVLDIVISDELVDIAFLPVDPHEVMHRALVSSSCEQRDYPIIGDIMLWRLTGVAFSDKKELRQYCKDYAVADKVDTLELASKQKLITVFHERPIWLARGLVVYEKLQELWKASCKELNLQLIKSAGMPRERKTDDPFDELIYYPSIISNEPSHLHLLPRIMRLADLHERIIDLPPCEYEGLFRLPHFFSDTLHMMVQEDALEQEIACFLKIASAFMERIGIPVEVELKLCKQTQYHEPFQKACKLDGLIRDDKRQGPRIEIYAKDNKRRKWLLSFIELDMVLTQMLKRPVFAASLLYSIERVLALLLEKNGGFLPCMLSPIQARLTPIVPSCINYCHMLKERMEGQGIRIDIDERFMPIGEKSFRAFEERIPFLVSIGEKEVNEQVVSVKRLEMSEQPITMSPEEFIKHVLDLSR